MEDDYEGVLSLLSLLSDLDDGSEDNQSPILTHGTIPRYSGAEDSFQTPTDATIPRPLTAHKEEWIEVFKATFNEVLQYT